MFKKNKEYSQLKVNLSNPFKGRRWLNLLKVDNKLGFFLTPNVNIRLRSILGFTFKSNKYGFHGSECHNANNVILGTSFGMGFGVDEGKNWFQLEQKIEQNYFNLSLPVSPKNHLNALDKEYSGNYSTLIYLYHPNVWKIASGFYKAEFVKQDIFEYLGWKKSKFTLLYSLPKWILKSLYMRIKGIHIKHKYKEIVYSANCHYNLYDKNKPELQRSLNDLIKIFSRFQRVYVFRIPIKEQIINNRINNKKLKELNQNYDECWESLENCKEIQSMGNIDIIDLCKSADFNLDDYLSNDTHWSPSGNQVFFNIVSKYI